MDRARGAGPSGSGRERALIAAALVAALYVAFLGWPAPATRAAALAAVLALVPRRASDRCRPTRCSPPPVSASCWLTRGPCSISGGWLSAAALWGATACTRWSDRALGTARGLALPRVVGRGHARHRAAHGAGARHGGDGGHRAQLRCHSPRRRSRCPESPRACSLWPFSRGLADALAGGSGLLLHLLELLARAGAAVPGGHLITGPRSRGRVAVGAGARRPSSGACTAGPPGWWPCGAGAGRSPSRSGFRWSLALGPSAHPDGRLALHFLDVGQGDGAVIRTPGGRFVVVDAGPRSERADAGRRVVAPFLARQRAGRARCARRFARARRSRGRGRRGARAVSRRRGAGARRRLRRSRDTHGFSARSPPTGCRGGRAGPGDSFTLDGVRFTLLHPDTAWSGWGEDLNEDSLILSVEYGGVPRALSGRRRVRGGATPRRADRRRQPAEGGASRQPGIHG